MQRTACLLLMLGGAALAACAAPGEPPRVAACDSDIARYKHAARAGDAAAQYRLAARYYVSWLNPGMCAAGNGADDAVEAHRWFTLAAAQGVGVAARYRDLVAEGMTRSQIDEANRRAAAWPGAGG